MSNKTSFDFSKMMEDFRKRIPSREESYKKVCKNENSFNFWFRKLIGPYNVCPFEIPKTVYFELPFERWEWLTSDSYNDEDIEEFNNYLNTVLSRSDFRTEEYFIKTGTFSNKFDFETCHITDTSQLGEKFFDVFYTDMMFGAGSTPHVVIREFIPSNSQYHIYNGMPLRRELRFFWDFDESKLLGHSLYWHPEEMKQMVRGIFENDDELDTFVDNADVTTLQGEHFRNLRDYITFSKFHEENKDLYDNDLDIVVPKLKEFLASNKELTDSPLEGKWSIDIMHEDGKYYLIDAAQMANSALINRMVTENV